MNSHALLLTTMEAAGALSLARLGLSAAQSWQRQLGSRARRVALMVSADSTLLLPQLLRRPGPGYRPALVYEEGAATGAQREGLPVIGDFDTFRSLLRGGAIRELWLLAPLDQAASLERLVQEFRQDFVDIRFIPDLRAYPLARLDQTRTGTGAGGIHLVGRPWHARHPLGKRAFDLAFSATVLLMLAPLLALIALAIRIDSPGPALFLQQRMGADGRRFTIYKFRTMRVHSEGPGTLSQARRNDARVTRLGRLLRRTSLDELPQFLNVLKGQMSVVGPRPHALPHDNQYKELVRDYMYRYRIKPGITGWAQVNGLRGEIDCLEKMSERVAHDLHYIQHRTLALDLKIVAMTVHKGLVHRNAY